MSMLKDKTIFQWGRVSIFFRTPSKWQTSSSSPDFEASSPIQDKSREFRSSPSRGIVTKNLKEETDFRDFPTYRRAGLHLDQFIPSRNKQEQRRKNY